MGKLFDRVKVATATTGAGTMTLGAAERSAVLGDFNTFAEAGAVDGDIVSYVIVDGANFAMGEGVYSSTGPTLTRDPAEVRWNGTVRATAALSLSGAAKVFSSPIARDLARGDISIGDYLQTMRSTAPDGFLTCDGSIQTSASYPVLAAMLANVFGAVKLTDPAALSFQGGGAAFSPEGTYAAVVTTVSPYLYIYKRTGDSFALLSSPATGPAGNARGCSFSPDGVYLAVAHDTTPFVTIYKRSGDTFTKLANPASLPAGNAFSAAFSGDGTHLVIGHVTTPFFTVYSRSGDTFTKLANPASLPPGTGAAVAATSDATYISVASSSSPYLALFKRTGTTLTKLTDPSSMPPGVGRGTALTQDGTYLAVTHDTAPLLTIYKRAGDVFTKLPDPAVLPSAGGANSGAGVAFTADATTLAVGRNANPAIYFYDRTGDVFTKLADPASTPTGTCQGVSFYGSSYAVLATGTSPYAMFYKNGGTQFKLPVIADEPAVPRYNYIRAK